MDLELVKKAVQKQWATELMYTPPALPPEAKYITGSQKHDAYLHYLETQCGIEVKLSDNFYEMVDYRVVDDKKFTWFMLRWA